MWRHLCQLHKLCDSSSVSVCVSVVVVAVAVAVAVVVAVAVAVAIAVAVLRLQSSFVCQPAKCQVAVRSLPYCSSSFFS